MAITPHTSSKDIYSISIGISPKLDIPEVHALDKINGRVFPIFREIRLIPHLHLIDSEIKFLKKWPFFEASSPHFHEARQYKEGPDYLSSASC